MDERRGGQRVYEVTQRGNKLRYKPLSLAHRNLNHLSKLDRMSTERSRQVFPVARRGNELRVVQRMHRHADHDRDDAAGLVDEELEKPTVARLRCDRAERAALCSPARDVHDLRRRIRPGVGTIVGDGRAAARSWFRRWRSRARAQFRTGDEHTQVRQPSGHAVVEQRMMCLTAVRRT